VIDPEKTLSEEPRVPVVEVTGEIDMYTSAALRARLTGMIERGHRHFVVDLSQVTFIDSAGLGVLVWGLK
jgi:anti-sigma B factor antagonist